MGGGDRLERRTDVVHDRRAGDERRLGHLGLGGVDRHDRVGAGSNDALDDRNDTITFGRDIDRRGARTGRLAPDIDDGGTLVEERERMGDRRSVVPNRPPSLNESGVTLTIPITLGMADQS